jgi:hypothetical protein
LVGPARLDLAHEDLPNITRNAAVAMSAGDEELGSLLTTVGRHLRFMDHSAIAAAFGGSSSFSLLPETPLERLDGNERRA